MLIRTSGSVEVRPFQSVDIASVYELERLCFKDPYPWWLLTELARKNPDTFIVAVIKNTIAGYAVIDKRLEENSYHLVSIAVHPGERRKGIATTMLQTLDMKLLLGKKLLLEVRESNSPAIEFYRKHNFIKTGNIPSYYSDGEAAMVMEKRTTGG